MAAGPGTDVGDAVLLLFTQTAAERAHTRAHKQVGVLELSACVQLTQFISIKSYLCLSQTPRSDGAQRPFTPLGWAPQ